VERAARRRALVKQILSVEDDVAGCHITTGCPGIVLRSTRDDKGEVPCQRQKWTRWSVLTIFLNEKGEADFASDCNPKKKFAHLPDL
jgi:hypothetical protein